MSEYDKEFRIARSLWSPSSSLFSNADAVLSIFAFKQGYNLLYVEKSRFEHLKTKTSDKKTAVKEMKVKKWIKKKNKYNIK